MMRRRLMRAQLRTHHLERRDVPSTYVEMEPNDVIGSANAVPMATGDILATATDDWLTVEGQLANISDRDYFGFTLATPAAVFFDLDSRDTGLSVNLNAVLNLYDSTGLTFLASNDTGYDFDGFSPPAPPAANAGSPDPSLVVDLPAGSYLIRVTSFQSNTLGDYHLRMLADSITLTAPPPWHSNVGAAVTLYLDVDGHSATDEWGTYAAAPFDLTGDAGKYTPDERLALANIWRVVAEDFAPFNIDVTTVEPPSFADGVGFRVVLTSSPASVVGQGTARGAALIGSFTGTGVNTGFTFQPSFSDYLGGVSGQVVASALEEGNETSRQFARALGLRDYGGLNPQLSGIMQAPDAGLGRATWSLGVTHSGVPPIVLQDDLASLMAGGLSVRADDHGDTIAMATPLSGPAGGLITGNSSDRDCFSFAGTMGVWLVRAAVDPYDGDLNAVMRVLQTDGQVLTTINPPGSFSAEGYVCLPVDGQYVLEVSSGGQGEVGRYAISTEFVTPVCPAGVRSVVVNSGAVQRSIVTDVLVQFSRTVEFPSGAPAAFQVTGPGGIIPIDIDLSPSTSLNTVARIRFPIGGGGFGSAPDGKMTLAIFGTDVTADGQEIDGDANGLPGGDFQFGFYRLFGDQDGDTDVDAGDFAVFRPYFGSPASIGQAFLFDADADGDVDTADFAQFRQRFGQALP